MVSTDDYSKILTNQNRIIKNPIILKKRIFIIGFLSIFILTLSFSYIFPTLSIFNIAEAQPNITSPTNSNITNLPPALYGISATPRSSTTDEPVIFLITYEDPEDVKPSLITIIIGNEKFNLQPVDPDDINYTNGKDYFIKLKLKEGIHIFYVKASDGVHNVTSSALTIKVITPSEENEFTHLDVAYSLLIATGIILIPIVYGIYQLSKLEKTLSSLTDTIKKKEKRVRENKKKMERYEKTSEIESSSKEE
jgi:hypothetical protein